MSRIHPTRDFPLSDVEAALSRASLRARELARQTRTPLVIVRRGVIVRVIPGDTPATDVLLDESGARTTTR